MAASAKSIFGFNKVLNYLGLTSPAAFEHISSAQEVEESDDDNEQQLPQTLFKIDDEGEMEAAFSPPPLDADEIEQFASSTGKKSSEHGSPIGPVEEPLNQHYFSEQPDPSPELAAVNGAQFGTTPIAFKFIPPEELAAVVDGDEKAKGKRYARIAGGINGAYYSLFGFGATSLVGSVIIMTVTGSTSLGAVLTATGVGSPAGIAILTLSAAVLVVATATGVVVYNKREDKQQTAEEEFRAQTEAEVENGLLKVKQAYRTLIRQHSALLQEAEAKRLLLMVNNIRQVDGPNGLEKLAEVRKTIEKKAGDLQKYTDHIEEIYVGSKKLVTAREAYAKVKADLKALSTDDTATIPSSAKPFFASFQRPDAYLANAETTFGKFRNVTSLSTFAGAMLSLITGLPFLGLAILNVTIFYPFKRLKDAFDKRRDDRYTKISKCRDRCEGMFRDAITTANTTTCKVSGIEAKREHAQTLVNHFQHTINNETQTQQLFEKTIEAGYHKRKAGAEVEESRAVKTQVKTQAQEIEELKKLLAEEKAQTAAANTRAAKAEEQLASVISSSDSGLKTPPKTPESDDSAYVSGQITPDRNGEIEVIRGVLAANMRGSSSSSSSSRTFAALNLDPVAIRRTPGPSPALQPTHDDNSMDMPHLDLDSPSTPSTPSKFVSSGTPPFN